ncbi:E77 [Murid betaherpesvirus 8]|uniref:E77 n=1 Tax=Rat cytomegalovirus (isolate England) TaxID=1261657 RepID=K7YNN9_RCMVE|nr:E77 [Murid betaherpesvirus 8]AFX83392.1 E77 [Murid betaherpesvirus 8]
MSLLKTFHDLPCIVAYEAHRENVLACPREVLARLRDEGALRLRQRAEDLEHGARLRRRAGEDLDALEKDLRDECKRFRDRIGEAERLLVESMSNFQDGSGEDGGVRSNVASEEQQDDGIRANKGTVCRDDGSVVWIVACDPPISFSEDFRGELVDTLFNVSQTWTFSFGSWYYRLKRWLYNQPRWRRVYRLTQIESLSVSQELLMGVLNATEQITVYPGHDAVLSDLEVAVCIMAAYQTALDPLSDMSASVEGVLRGCSRILRSMVDDLSAEVSVGVENAFSYRDPSGMRFYTPMSQGRKYAAGTFDENAIVSVLFRKGALSHLPGSSKVVSKDVMDRLSGVAHDDFLTLWALRLFGKRLGTVVPVITAEQHYLRSGITALLCLILLWKVLNSESVFSGRQGKFSLKDVFPDAFGENKCASEIEEGFCGADIKNFEFMIERYVLPWYSRNPSVTISQLWPGLILLAYSESHRSGWDISRKVSDATESGVSAALHVQISKANPLVEYMMLQSNAAPDKDVERLAAHDYALFHCENGIGRLLSVTLPKHRVLVLGTQLFNLQTVYDVIYFFVLGFLPVINVA